MRHQDDHARRSERSATEQLLDRYQWRLLSYEQMKATKTATERIPNAADQCSVPPWPARSHSPLLAVELRAVMETVAETWDKAFTVAPPNSGPWVRYMDQEPTPKERLRSAEAQQRFAEQADIARSGVQQFSAALSRLNKLERRTTGR